MSSKELSATRKRQLDGFKRETRGISETMISKTSKGCEWTHCDGDGVKDLEDINN